MLKLSAQAKSAQKKVTHTMEEDGGFLHAHTNTWQTNKDQRHHAGMILHGGNEGDCLHAP